MKKITLLLTAVLVVSAATLYAQQYNPDSDFRIDWDRNVKDTIVITKYVGTRSEVRIPPKIQNNTVNRIGTGAFEYTNITSVIIPNGVTIIEDNAFQRCTRLTSVSIPNSVSIISDSTFSHCTSLTSVTIPTSVTRIEGWAFSTCTSLTSITIPNSVNRIGMFAFVGCTNLTSVTFQGAPAINTNLSFDGNLGSVYDGIGTYTRFAGGEIWKANFTPAEQARRAAKPYFDSGYAAYNKGDYDKAIADYTQAIRLDPNYITAYNNRADAYNNKGDYDRAIADATQAIRIDPNYITAYNNRAFAYNGKGDYDRAIADATQAIRIDPNFANPYRHRGYAYMMKGNYTQARADTNKSLQLNPNYQRAKDLDAELKRRGY